MLFEEKEGIPMKRLQEMSFRYKLMAFVFLLCIVIIGTVYVLSVVMLEPAYNSRVRQDLSATLDTLTDIVDEASEQGSLISYYWMGQPYVREDFRDLLNQKALDGTLQSSGRCIEISTSSGQSLIRSEALPGICLVHSSKVQFGVQDGTITSELATRLRLQTAVQGQLEQILQSSSTGSRQLVMGRTAGNGEYVVLVSTDLERIPQAMAVLTGQMSWVSLLVVAISLAAAWIFSGWFTRPLRQLSHAAREMAHGNYDVRVQVTGQDEVATLAQDFNFMASEVARSAQLQRDLVANISHDLRTPLTLIKGYAETVRDLTGSDPERRTRQLNVIVEETDRLSALVNSVMELSRMSSGTEKPQKVTFDMAQLCEEVAQRYEDVCARNGYTLEVKADTPCMVNADAAMMERVLHNLLGNALHHIGEDGWLGLSALPTEGGGCRVEVSDHGCGIAPEDLPHLFDKYYRSRKDAGKVGTGLGLSITKAILQSHGFRFGVQSQVGEGSTFWFETSAPAQSLPAAQS